jgi:hypothetical protein
MQKIVIANHTLVTEISRLVNEGTQVTFVPKGSSMHPFIRGGIDSVVLIKDDDIKPLDIVLAKVGGSYVLHRVLTTDEDRITLMGDGNLSGKEHCFRKDILAKVINIIKDGKQIDCTGKTHKIKAMIWKSLFPIRRYLLAIYRRILIK